ncbi:guanylate cyclase soluble subunit beta-2-like [Ruditapes philippinarum]|uniref:guanylate cyclase soluble subunit beta-2-like n=1 Tax=Ruditapes philippinarum TaxID=129788 RepID=UPI00295B2A67|nr:guanylate cyclase soluble subunit beta-2-like [Ruditapes philippinarum]
MYGHFNLVFRSFIIERQGGEQVWEKIVAQSKCEPDFDNNYVYDEDITDRMITRSIDILGLPREPLLEMLGEYYLIYMQKRGYDEMLRNLGSNILEFLQNLDSVHGLSRRDYPDMVAPSFRCDEGSVSDRMVLHYYSARKGLYPVVKGLTVEAAKAFYKMQLQMDVQKIETECVADERGEREHVTFDIIAKKIKEQVVQEGPPTFIAQTKKHSERQILQEDVEAVKLKLEQIRKELGEGALPLNRKKTVKARWRIAVKITAMHKGFVPNYPPSLPINPRMFIEIFPYHVTLDKDLKIVQSGLKLQILMPNIRSRQALLTDFFTIRYPNCVDLTYKNIERFVLCPFILELRKDAMEENWSDRPALQIKGQMFLLRDNGFYVFIASPVAHSWADLENRKLKFADIPMWDVTRDFLVADLEYRKCLENNVRTSLGGSTNNRARRISNQSVGRGSMADDAAVKERLNRMQKELDNERQRSNTLYLAFLPKDVVDLVHRGHIPCGEFYNQASALFCDVVHFLPMVAKCSPAEIVGILNSLQAKFDKVTRVHNSFKVESIGDAYLVIAGVGEKKESHAERIANTALGMVVTAREIRSPLDGDPIQLRIGVHTGSLVTGIIGHKVPRFVVMGETSVVASKLESHGEPGKIHVSPTTYRALQNKSFVFVDRGKIELRGYGPLQTYFLVRNEGATDDELIGRSKFGNQDITYINEGKVDTPFVKGNKVHPANESPSSGVGSRTATGESDFTPFQYK